MRVGHIKALFSFFANINLLLLFTYRIQQRIAFCRYFPSTVVTGRLTFTTLHVLLLLNMCFMGVLWHVSFPAEIAPINSETTTTALCDAGIFLFFLYFGKKYSHLRHVHIFYISLLFCVAKIARAINNLRDRKWFRLSCGAGKRATSTT